MKQLLTRYGVDVKHVIAFLIAVVSMVELSGIWTELREANKRLRRGVNINDPVRVEVDNTPLDVQVER